MSDSVSGNLSVETYISKQEGLLLEHIRRLLQAETKISLLEVGIQELNKKNRELKEQVDTCNVTINQSIAGLSAVTVERDKLQQEVETLKSTLNDCNIKLNSQLVINTELEKLKEKLSTAESDYATLKENYNRVLASLDQAAPKQELMVPAPEKKKKLKITESEWTDGEY